MEVERPNTQPLTPEETQELDRLRRIVESAAADGIITQDEISTIRNAALSQKPSYELLQQELSIYRDLITKKVNAGLLVEE